MRKIFHGEKTFVVEQDFIFRGTNFVKNSLFSCTQEDHIRFAHCLGEEYISKRESVEEKPIEESVEEKPKKDMKKTFKFKKNNKK